ncbi:MAG: prepilin-type N-terminal cleavage/methylation domain-containing protein [Lachnospiraceae bacterium]|nr:prepilin-type N-terminal cleavage/methylation domain-containing protein [Lachnospiraceae bacterium]
MWRRRRGTEQINRKSSTISNSGFSLVELLIAVTILAIIVIPLLHMFITSTKINVKSRQTLRATTVAQDIMEGLKAYTLEEVRSQFEPPEGAEGSGYHYPTDGFYVIDSSMIQGGVRELTELEHEGEEIYYFGIENIKLQGGEYDAFIELDASTYGSKAEEKRKNPGAGIVAHDNEFNGNFYAELGSVAEVSGSGDEESKATDSSFHENKKLNEAVLQDVKQQIEADIISSGGTVPDDLDELKLEDVLVDRTIDVVIEDADSKDSEGNEQCKATITFTYLCGYGDNNYISNGKEGSVGGVVNGIPRTFSSGNFYLFYYPCYDVRKDRINIRFNDAGKLFDADKPLMKSFVLAKQIRSEVDSSLNSITPEMSELELWNKEDAYSAIVSIGADAALNSELVFRTNIDTNMVKNTSDGKRDSLWGVITSFDSNVMPRIKQCSFTGDDVSEKTTDVIYDAKITVYKSGAAKHFTEADFEDNEEVHKLATITNWD